MISGVLIAEYVAFALAGCITVSCLAVFVYVSLRKGEWMSCGEFLGLVCPCLAKMGADPDDGDLVLIPREEHEGAVRQGSGIFRAKSGQALSYGTM
jgi:hypothetical protein